jgi:hypothetical protein
MTDIDLGRPVIGKPPVRRRGARALFSRRFEIGCTVEIEHTSASLHAYVELDGDVAIEPGDEVLVHDAPTDVPFGEKVSVRRQASVVQAGLIRRGLARLGGLFELTELYEVSFSDRRRL